MTKPQLAEDAQLDRVIFPCGVQPKIDGVRALQLAARLTGRSLDPFEGYGITDYFTGLFPGGDGEMTLGSKPNCTDRLCSRTTGAMGRIYEEDNKKVLITHMADLHWWLFDLVTDDTVDLAYKTRYDLLAENIRRVGHPRLHLVPMEIARNRKELDAIIVRLFNEGYEGAIIRNLEAPYKEGRATQKGQQIWRVKSWADFEILVTRIFAAEENTNEKKTNSLGRSERSSAKAGKVAKEMLGSMEGTLLADFYCPISGKLLFKKGLLITAGRGEMTAKEAAAYHANPHTIVGWPVKVKHMTHGVKDLPRFPTYVAHRLRQDL